MIKLWAITGVKDEEDVIDHTLYHLAAEGVDGAVVADNMSSDSTRDKLNEAKEKLHGIMEVIIIDDPEVAYKQDYKMTTMARTYGASRNIDWFIPFDADELWFSRQGTLKEVFQAAHEHNKQTIKPLYTNHALTNFDIKGNSPYDSMIYKWSLPTNFKTAFKFRSDISISNGNHFVYWNVNGHSRDENPLLDVVEIRHFQYRSKEHFIRKILNAYTACKALPENADLRGGAAWKEQFLAYEAEGLNGLENYFYKNIFSNELGDLIKDPAPYKGKIYE